MHVGPLLGSFLGLFFGPEARIPLNCHQEWQRWIKALKGAAGGDYINWKFQKKFNSKVFHVGDPGEVSVDRHCDELVSRCEILSS